MLPNRLILPVLAMFMVSTNAASLADKIGDLPKDVIADIYSILIKGAVKLTGNCSTSERAPEVQYWLYTRNNPDGAVIKRIDQQMDKTKPVVILIHGWLGNANVDYIWDIKEGYLKVNDYNIISVDYNSYAVRSYQTTYCHMPAIGKNIARFICDLYHELHIHPRDLHLVGHSLGGQVSGFAGQYAQDMCGLVGRITALDPAGPLYQNMPTKERLDKTDAEFVDVIHTNQGVFGYTGNCGHVDFYPNCGFVQPGCLNVLFDQIPTMSDILDMNVALVNCHHTRSCLLFAESITNDAFFSTNCHLCGTPACFHEMITKSHTYMGESCRGPQKFEEYMVKTNYKSPFARGPARRKNF